MFLRLANFYRKFIKYFFALEKNFTNLLKKEGLFKWKDEQQSVFNLLKGKLLLALVLQFSNFANSFEMHTNASGFAIGVILM